VLKGLAVILGFFLARYFSIVYGTGSLRGVVMLELRVTQTGS
jgi:hypothetical protein